MEVNVVCIDQSYHNFVFEVNLPYSKWKENFYTIFILLLQSFL